MAKNENKNVFIIIRIEDTVKDKLIKLAGGSRKLSSLVREILKSYV